MWQIWIDVGGTFTDYWAQSPDGQIRQTKVLRDVFQLQLRVRSLNGILSGIDSSGEAEMVDCSGPLLEFVSYTKVRKDFEMVKC